MAETDMRGRVVRELREWDAVAVENPAHPGTPDVNHIYGWVELKWTRRWPLRGGPLRIEHFTQGQKVWLTRRCRRGGEAYLLLQVGRQWLLFWGEVAAKVVGQSTREELLKAACHVWLDGLKKGELKQCLSDLRNKKS